ncbi:hypothetical protein [Rhodopirellula sp. MGV]|uniref:hypothetical protein n=1 Tax=Rhodopirellula sp. MGV TaxID=2023130 RepID=UPI000B964DFD|nr:hypothetical protein [Rhodopirellula sp. MGV]OYP38186.1 hypothetical protein CGZ80_02875 [Rhodopirellula sp. MGV]PNY38519.1 hypothetical protein C2E31_00905 [Rhodopirellula baltica]
MPKCDLSIELDEPERIYRTGDKVRGTVSVETDDSVKCKGLTVTSGWRTHGRGNVAKGTAETATVFAGLWEAGQRESYRFELEVADWPPTYYGNYVNVEHFIDARVKIPWAFDPKASHEFTVRPLQAPAAAYDGSREPSGCFVKAFIAFVVIGMVWVFVGALAAFIAIPWVGTVIALVAIPLTLLIAAKTVLPMLMLGKVHSELVDDFVTPGENAKVKLSFQPRRNVSINQISATLTGAEVCVSGSGSNRTTHRHQFFESKHELLSETTLQAGNRREFDLAIPIPGDAPYSFDLSDNDLKWTIKLHIDLPRWPDWSRELNVHVLPNGSVAPDLDPRLDPLTSDLDTDESALHESEVVAAAPPTDGEITFAETATHLWQSRHNESQVDLLVEAVLGMTFDMSVFVERRLLYSGREDPHVYPNGYAVWARHDNPPLPLVLYVPHELADEFEQAGRDKWPIRGTVVGWDREHDRLQVKVID